jgi:RNA polymerase sigma factor (sigma-70 family)
MMMKQPMATDVDGLLGQVRWVEAFARALVREDSEDVAQDAWLAAIQRPPASAASPRPWFATVMRNLTRMRFRGASRRRAREEASTTSGEVPTPAELAHRMELQRRLASAVVALEEPQRSTVVLVFYEGLSPAEIARRHGVPATTVRSRLRAALVTLRQRLDAEEGGDRSRWHLALAPIVPKLVPGTTPLWPIAFAAIAVIATTLVVIAIAVAVQRDATRADVQRDDAGTIARSINTAVPPMVGSASWRAPDPASLHGASSPAIETTHVGGVSSAFSTAEKTLMKHVDECYEISHRIGRDLKGIVQLTISVDTSTPSVTAKVDVDHKRTTITDPDFLECVRENATAIEDQLEHLSEQGEHLEGLTVDVAREMPPSPAGMETVGLSSADGDVPSCPEGTTLAGTQGVQQWCALPDGTKHGPEWRWDKQGRVTGRASYEHGAISMETSSIEAAGPEGD